MGLFRKEVVRFVHNRNHKNHGNHENHEMKF